MRPAVAVNLLPEFTRSPAFRWSMLLFALLGIGFSVVRTYKEYAPVADSAPISPEMDFSRPGMFDFHMGGYLPALAFRERVNPYSPDALEHYPMQRPAPTYSPVVFLIHLPFSFLSVTVADVVYYVFNVGLLGLLAYWSLTMSYVRANLGVWLGIVGLFAFSRAGHMTLVTGYSTLQLVIGTVLALHFAKTKPWLAGLGMLLASGKPTYIIPLVVLMVARKNFKAVMIGLCLSALVTAGGIAWLASSSSLHHVIDGIHAGEASFHADDNETPENTWTRLDLVGMIAKVIHWKPDNKVYLIAMFALLIPPSLLIWKSVDHESNSGATGLTAMIVVLAMLVTIYHHAYDCLLVAIPFIGLTLFGTRVCPELKKSERVLLSILLAIPAINYASTYKVRELLRLENHSVIWDVLTSINGVCLVIALVVVSAAAVRVGRQNKMALH